MRRSEVYPRTVGHVLVEIADEFARSRFVPSALLEGTAATLRVWSDFAAEGSWSPSPADLGALGDAPRAVGRALMWECIDDAGALREADELAGVAS